MEKKEPFLDPNILRKEPFFFSLNTEGEDGLLMLRAGSSLPGGDSDIFNRDISSIDRDLVKRVRFFFLSLTE